LVVALCVCALALTACDRPVPPEATVPKPAPRLTVLPDLEGKTLVEAQAALASVEITTVVRFASEAITRAVDATSVAGTIIPAHVSRFAIPERLVELGQLEPGPDGFSHRIVAQTPAAGTPLSSVTTLTLDAGPHPHESDVPWLSGHAAWVRDREPTDCFVCHNENDCAYCHTQALPWR
jgi:hypothetical protein